VRALLLPLAFKQMHSTRKLHRVAPQLKAIQAEYKDDKQRQQQGMMRFYKENEINPFASFLPLLAQIPVFIGLYYTLRTRLRDDICPALRTAGRYAYHLAHPHVPLRDIAGMTFPCHGLSGSSWLFIHDLTSTATGLTLIVLIVLYVGTQLASSLMAQAPTMDQTQGRITLLLPLLFVILMIKFPAGVILYWITTNTWTIGQQWVIRRRIGPAAPAAPAAPAPSPSGRDGRRASATNANASGAGDGLPGLRRGKPKSEEKQPAAVGSSTRSRRDAAPPPPRRTKRRSGRRR
jgi:YidC/Oxa1 family membrane protein insertase